ncbi:MAG: hypothetical protein LBL69_03980 [Zoogloeaceae bacterium]|jgi:hypothetical protein|nr:hypothetical protein [Zoogloeaceae bacterium]
MSALRFLAFFLLTLSATAQAWDRPPMAKYGAAYRGPELMMVYVAANQAGDHALVRVTQINHALDGHIFWTKVRYPEGHPERAYYLLDDSSRPEGERTLLFVEDGSAKLSLPDWHGQKRAEIPLTYDRSESAEVLPEHLATAYEQQLGQTKP